MTDYSQNGEQALLQTLCQKLGISRGVSCEFGASDGVSNSNTRWCREAGWRCVMWDGESKAGEVQPVWVTPENVNELFEDNDLTECDLCSIDVDGLDWWIWHALEWDPKIVIIEYNQNCPPDSSVTIAYDPEHRFDMSDYYGASYNALLKLAEKKGYKFYASTLLNIIFVRDDLEVEPVGKLAETFHRCFPSDPHNRKWVEV